MVEATENEPKDTDGISATDSSATSWIDNLPACLKTAKSVRKFKDVPSLVRSYLEAERKISRRIALPDADASDKEWHKFYRKTGMPEDKKYIGQRNAKNEKLILIYEELFYQAGLSKRQGERLFHGLNEYCSELRIPQIREIKVYTLPAGAVSINNDLSRLKLYNKL